MHLTPRELDKLVLNQAGFLAQRRLARGLRLNYVEAVALIATQILEFIRDGRSVAELMNLGRNLLGTEEVLAGVAEMVEEVQVEGTFPDGTKLVTVHQPIVSERGDPALTFYGTFLPLPEGGHSVGKPLNETGAAPGAVVTEEGEITLNEGRDVIQMEVANRGDRPVQVGSHYHFLETNRALSFDRPLAYGRRLDIPAGTAVRFEPGETKTVALVPIAGERVVRGGNAWVSGPVTEGRHLDNLE